MVSIIIPTKNGAEYLEELLRAVFTQKTDFEFEVIIVDSGSQDRTLEIVKKFPVKLYQILPQDFNHGLTRNLAASKAKGEYLVFLTQDAAPANENWLAAIVRPMIKDEAVAGVFGRHLPRKNCDPFQKKTLGEFFEAFGKTTTVWQLGGNSNMDSHFHGNDKERKNDKKGNDKKRMNYRKREEEFKKNKHILTYFSNVNSAIRKSVWQRIPFQEVQMGEDQFWAKEIILAGYKKAYEPEAAVEHSHNFGIWNQFKRWFDEYRQHKINQNYIGVNSWLKIFPLTCRLTLNDIKYISTQKDYRWEQKIYWSIWIFFVNLARFSAQYLGGHYEKLPSSLQNRFSMQWQIINK